MFENTLLLHGSPLHLPHLWVLVEERQLHEPEATLRQAQGKPERKYPTGRVPALAIPGRA